MSRRPYYKLWLGPERLPISVSNAGYGQPLRFDRQMADRRADLLVTDDYFDHLQSEADRPARTPDPKMVNFFRSMRGQVVHESPDGGCA